MGEQTRVTCGRSGTAPQAPFRQLPATARARHDHAIDDRGAHLAKDYRDTLPPVAGILGVKTYEDQ